MSTLQAHYPLQEVNVFFNGTEYNRQKFFSTQKTLSFGISMIRSDIETFLNRSNDNSHLSKTWYLDAINRFIYGGGKTNFGGYYPSYNGEFEKKYHESAGPFDSNTLNNNFKFERFSIEMSLRKTFDGMQGSTNLPIKSYDAPTSGVWFGPYFDCQKRYMKTKTTLRLSYSVPIITSSSKLPMYFIYILYVTIKCNLFIFLLNNRGFVSIVVGSDLKWWKINPCDTSNEKNMFQSLHRCDAETTMVNFKR